MAQKGNIQKVVVELKQVVIDCFDQVGTKLDKADEEAQKSKETIDELTSKLNVLNTQIAQAQKETDRVKTNFSKLEKEFLKTMKENIELKMKNGNNSKKKHRKKEKSTSPSASSNSSFAAENNNTSLESQTKRLKIDNKQEKKEDDNKQDKKDDGDQPEVYKKKKIVLSNKASPKKGSDYLNSFNFNIGKSTSSKDAGSSYKSKPYNLGLIKKKAPAVADQSKVVKEPLKEKSKKPLFSDTVFDATFDFVDPEELRGSGARHLFRSTKSKLTAEKPILKEMQLNKPRFNTYKSPPKTNCNNESSPAKEMAKPIDKNDEDIFDPNIKIKKEPKTQNVYSELLFNSDESFNSSDIELMDPSSPAPIPVFTISDNSLTQHDEANKIPDIARKSFKDQAEFDKFMAVKHYRDTYPGECLECLSYYNQRYLDVGADKVNLEVVSCEKNCEGYRARVEELRKNPNYRPPIHIMRANNRARQAERENQRDRYTPEGFWDLNLSPPSSSIQPTIDKNRNPIKKPSTEGLKRAFDAISKR